MSSAFFQLLAGFSLLLSFFFRFTRAFIPMVMNDSLIFLFSVLLEAAWKVSVISAVGNSMPGRRKITKIKDLSDVESTLGHVFCTGRRLCELSLFRPLSSSRAHSDLDLALLSFLPVLVRALQFLSLINDHLSWFYALFRLLTCVSSLFQLLTLFTSLFRL